MLLGEEDGLGEIQPIEVAEVLVVVVVAVTPVVKREVHIHPDHLSHKLIHGNRREEREVSHIMKLYEEAHHVERVDSPTQHSQIDMYQSPSQNLDRQGECDGSPCFAVVGLDVVVDETGDLVSLSACRHSFIFIVNKSKSHLHQPSLPILKTHTTIYSFYFHKMHGA